MTKQIKYAKINLLNQNKMTTIDQLSQAPAYEPQPLARLSGEAKAALGADVGAEVRAAIQENRAIDSSVYSALEALGYGWKAHLNFDYQDQAKVQKIDQELADMKSQGLFAGYKIGQGGGEAAGQSGKESTVYIGSRARLDQVATELQARLGGDLLPIAGEALSDDVQVSDLVAARFDIHGIDTRFAQYGAQGHGLLVEDIDPWNQTRTQEAATQAASTVLAQTYGEYFTG